MTFWMAVDQLMAQVLNQLQVYVELTIYYVHLYSRIWLIVIA